MTDKETTEKNEEAKPEEATPKDKVNGNYISIDPKARVEWKASKDGEVTETERVYRSLPSILAHLKTKAGDKPEGTYVEVYISATEDGSHGPIVAAEAPKEIRLKIAEGDLTGTIASLEKRCVNSALCVNKIHLLLSQMAEISSLKGAIITAVFDEGSAGVGFMSESSEVSEEDIKQLGEAAANQAEMFKDAMRSKKGISFPSDGNIITPSGAMPKLRVIEGSKG